MAAKVGEPVAAEPLGAAATAIGAGNAATPSGFNDRFEVVHAGALYYGRSLSTFLQAVARLIHEDTAFASVFQLTLLGTLDTAARAELDRAALGDRVEYRGQVDHAVAQATMRQASALLLVANTTAGAEATVPGKLFEYLALGRPILAIAPAESSTADVLEQTQCGWLARADDLEHITCVLRKAFAGHRTGTVPAADPERVAQFDRRRLAGRLAGIFDDARSARQQR